MSHNSRFLEQFAPAAQNQADHFGDTWKRYRKADGSLTRRHKGGGRVTTLAPDLESTFSGYLASPPGGETILNTDTPDAVAVAERLLSPDNLEYQVVRPVDDTRTSWIIKRINAPVS